MKVARLLHQVDYLCMCVSLKKFIGIARVFLAKVNGRNMNKTYTFIQRGPLETGTTTHIHRF